MYDRVLRSELTQSILSEGHFETSKVYHGKNAHVDSDIRVSESAILEQDEVTRQIRRRARQFRGWHGNKTVAIQPLKVQRYSVNGYYSVHYDWDGYVTEGNRVATFMIYLVDSCTGGGTNFPRLRRPVDSRWCSIIECEDDEYPGLTFKPIAGSAVFWENMHSNGSFHRGVRHASLPVKSGEKVGLNIWLWDHAWRPPLVE
ncbi:hypothetical protein MAA_11832 [Metarhizium robertsii ARSEF 23]|uniref:Fe2OG dioxygenase domain-containing protein n=1 Tax=Metarhizium robertsii (strain ARSEF 23 / ATCC MYA-3075) TaxID=655844 RepID=A0A0B2XG83_METRA|nr:uncharacterized protein MAA_11832 [Metarhizium robertsii ARSEF 23]KHO10567.1 hypothetical protein MAA_11832 [Metarhizium robertsii ARSEF 23]